MEPAGGAEIIDALRAALADADGVLTERADLAAYERGWRYGEGRALAVARPRTTEEVSRVLAGCDRRGVRVLPAGARTGLVGASVPDGTGTMVVLSLERMTRRLEIDPLGATALVDAGVTLGQLNEALRPHGLQFPIDLGADPQIGGMVATNTGGSRLVRHGDVRANLLGLEAVLPDGRVVSRLSALRKDNTGLDVKQLFVGTFGAFGVVTAAVLRLSRIPAQTSVALVRLRSADAGIRLLAAVERGAGELLSAFEVMSAAALESVQRHANLERDPLGGNAPPYTALVELSTSLTTAALDLDEVLAEVLGDALEQDEDGVEDVVLGDAEDFWGLRHRISECIAEDGEVLGLDVSVPRSRIAAFTEEVRAIVASVDPDVRVCDFGHWGDGGSHVNLVRARGVEPWASRARLQSLVYELCVNEYGGSYSAEHGVGPHNRDAYERFTDRWTRDVAAAIAPKRLGRVEL